MTLVEGVRGKLLPVGPNLFEHLGVVAVLLSTADELGLHVVQLVAQLFSHGLTQGVALAAGKVGQQAREEHHLLLIDRDAIGILEVLLHDGDIVLNGLTAPLAVDEVGDVIHRSRAVEGVHGDEVLEGAGLQLAQVLLHTGRLELEGADGASLAVELVGGRVVNGDGIDINHLSGMEAHVLHRLLDDGEGLEAQEVHLDESGIFNHAAFVLGDEHLLARLLVIGGAHGYPVGDVVAADDGATGMHARAAHVALEHLGILHRVAHQGVGRGLGSLQLGHVGNGIGQVKLLVRYLVGHELAEAVALREGELLHAGHILDGHLGSHGAVGDDVGHLLLAILLGHPAEHLAAAIVVEIHVDIRQGDTVGVKEALKQQVVLDRVDFGDAQAVSHR